MQRTIFVGVILLVAAGGFLWWRSYGFNIPQAPGSVACTMEAKLCPDGSYVGRQGPSCEFAACPTVASTTPSGTTLQIKGGIGESIQGAGVVISPILVLEDSRCPTDVQCIQAGTVRVRTQLQTGQGSAEQIFALNKPITTEAEIITLIEVTPTKNSKVTISPSDYVFTFKVVKR